MSISRCQIILEQFYQILVPRRTHIIIDSTSETLWPDVNQCHYHCAVEQIIIIIIGIRGGHRYVYIHIYRYKVLLGSLVWINILPLIIIIIVVNDFGSASRELPTATIIMYNIMRINCLTTVYVASLYSTIYYCTGLTLFENN